MAADGSLRESLTEKAAAMVPTLLERQREADELRRMPDSTHRDFLDAGFYRIFQPRRYGGLECENRTIIDIAVQLGRGCGSSSWVFTNLVAHSLVLSMNCVEAQDDVWGDNPEALIASGLSVTGATATPVEDGVLLDGLWSFSSGVDFADWLHLQVFVPQEEGPPEPRFALVPKGSFEIVDDWNATGLLATGSKSVRLENVFVPNYRTVAAGVLSGGKGLSRDINSAPIYQISIWSSGTQIFPAPAVGIARGALDYVEHEFRDRVGVVGVKLAGAADRAGTCRRSQCRDRRGEGAVAPGQCRSDRFRRTRRPSGARTARQMAAEQRLCDAAFDPRGRTALPAARRARPRFGEPLHARLARRARGGPADHPGLGHAGDQCRADPLRPALRRSASLRGRR